MRQPAFRELLKTIRTNIDPRFQQELSYGMPSWMVPHSLRPQGYHSDPKLPVPFLSLANQKNFLALYHMGLYADPEALEWFQEAYRGTGYTLDMGKSCIRFKKMDQIPYALVGDLVRRISLQQYLDRYSSVLDR